MALTETRPETESGGTAASEPVTPSRVEQLIGSGDHLTVGRLFIGFSLVLGTISALGIVLAGIDGLTEDGVFGLTDSLAMSSLVALVLTGAIPALLGLAIYIVPRQVGSPAIAFPRAAAAALWTWLIAAGIYLTGVALGGGIGGTDLEGAQLASLAMGAMMVSLSLGAICVATTVLSHRPLGMGLAKVPYFSWSMLVAAPVWILTFGSTVAHVFLGQITQADAAGLAAGFDSGIAWFLRAPSIYMIAIPVFGLAADVVATSAGRRIANYGLMQGLIAAYAVFSFGAWTQTSRALQTFVWVGFVLTAALPVLGLLGGLADTLRRGRIQLSTALMGALLAPLLVLGGVLAAALQGLDTAGSGNLFDLNTPVLERAQTYFLVGAALVGAIAGLAHWSRRLWNAAAPEGPGKGAVTAVFLGAGLLGTIHLLQSILARGDESGLASEAVNGIVAVGAALVALGILGGLAMILGAAKAGADTPDPDDEDGLTLEWFPPGPVVSGDSDVEIPFVRSPYPLADLRGGDSDEESS